MSWGELALPDDEGITVTLDTAQRHAWTAAGCSERGRQPASIPAANPVDITTRRAPSRWVAGVARQPRGGALYVRLRWSPTSTPRSRPAVPPRRPSHGRARLGAASRLVLRSPSSPWSP